MDPDDHEQNGSARKIKILIFEIATKNKFEKSCNKWVVLEIVIFYFFRAEPFELSSVGSLKIENFFKKILQTYLDHDEWLNRIALIWKFRWQRV